MSLCAWKKTMRIIEALRPKRMRLGRGCPVCAAASLLPGNPPRSGDASPHVWLRIIALEMQRKPYLSDEVAWSNSGASGHIGTGSPFCVRTVICTSRILSHDWFARLALCNLIICRLIPVQAGGAFFSGREPARMPCTGPTNAAASLGTRSNRGGPRQPQRDATAPR